MTKEELNYIKDAFSQIIDDIAGNPDWNEAARAVASDLGTLERKLEEKGCVNIEYIRKDFLIDKLARAKALRERSGSKDTEVFEVLTNLIKEL